uniref:Uncharacterized protein n=1 Tax=Babesia bovis TaxID=5865 RepID=S6BNS6_BABBO|nr:hypothetical protein [Babesia bovis]
MSMLSSGDSTAPIRDICASMSTTPGYAVLRSQVYNEPLSVAPTTIDFDFNVQKHSAVIWALGPLAALGTNVCIACIDMDTPCLGAFISKFRSVPSMDPEVKMLFSSGSAERHVTVAVCPRVFLGSSRYISPFVVLNICSPASL